MRVTDSFIYRLAQRLECPEAEARTVFLQCIKAIKQELLQGEVLSIDGFGTFSVRQTSERMGRNPKTNQPLRIKAKYVPVFKPGAALKVHINSFLQSKT